MESLNSNSQEREMHQLQQMQDKAKEKCMESFRLLHSHLKVLSIKGGFERACVALFDQDNQTFTESLLLNLDNLEKQLDREEFQETESIGAFRVLMKQFQTFINFRYCFDDFEGAMICKSFLENTRTEIQQFRDTLIQHMESVKKSIDERAQHKRENNRRVNDRVMQSKEGKVDSSKALDVNLVVTESSGIESRNDANTEDAVIRPVNDQEPLAKVQLTAQHNILANEEQHYVQSEPSYYTHVLEKVDSNTTPDSTNMYHIGGEIDQNAKKCQVSCPLLDPSFDNMTTEFSNQSLESKNISLKKTIAQLQKDFSRMEAHCVNMELKYENQALKDGQHGQILDETSNKAKFKKEIEILETINIELEHNVAKLFVENVKLHKENEHLKQTYKDLYDSIKKIRVQTKDYNASLIAQINSKTVENADLKAQIQEKVFTNVALKNELRKLKGNSLDSKFAKPSILGKPKKLRKRHKKKTQEKDRNSKTSVRPPAKSQNTTKSFKSKPRSNYQTSRVLPTSKSSFPTITAMPKADHSRNSSPFSDFKHFVCSTCQKCVFSENHDVCITKFRKEVNSHVKIQSPKTRDSTKLVEPTSHTQKPSRKIVTGHRFSPNKSFVVHEKTNTPRSYLRWIPTGRIFNTAGLRWVPTRKKFTSSTTKVDREPLNGSNEDITNPYECEQTLNVSAGTLNLTAGIIFKCTQMIKKTAMASVDNTSGSVPQKKKGLVPNPLPSTSFVPPTRTEWDILFQPLFDELLNPPPSVNLPAPEVIALIDEVVAPEPVVSTGSPSSTTVDQDAPSPSNSQTIPETQPPVIPNNVEEDNHDIEVAHMGNDPYFGILIPEVSFDQSSLSDTIHTIVPPDQ
ncbi:hypothetical protein Tco_0010809 [Tanacetum coccineum]